MCRGGALVTEIGCREKAIGNLETKAGAKPDEIWSMRGRSTPTSQNGSHDDDQGHEGREAG